MISWENIETVILDMDGTLLDLNFDRHVWHQAVPAAVASKRGQTAREIADDMEETLAEAQGTLAW
ncbi:MAG: haloacid dehalogenase, partial [Gammaproteobacteria bacterium]|nr:haloacid dehalogenase [Gammaproteobacteria bacterium]